MIRYEFSGRVPAELLPWVACVPQSGHPCGGQTVAKRPCRVVARYCYFDLDASGHWFCLDHFSTNRLSASEYGHHEYLAEEHRINQWARKNLKGHSRLRQVAGR